MQNTSASPRANPAINSALSNQDRTTVPNQSTNTVAQAVAPHSDTNLPKKPSKTHKVNEPQNFVERVSCLSHQTTPDYMLNNAKPELLPHVNNHIDDPSALAPNHSIGSASNYNQIFNQPNYTLNSYDYAAGQVPHCNTHVMNQMGPSYGDASLMYSPYGDMTIQSHDIDTSGLGEDMMSWLDGLPPDERYFYDLQNPNMMDYRDAG